MKAIQKLKVLFVLALLGWANVLFAENWSGSIGTKTYTSNTTINLTGNVTLTGRINVRNGATVTIKASDANRTITRGSSNTGLMFYVYENSTLKIVKNGDYVVTINGNSVSNSGSVIQVNNGSTAQLTSVTIKNNILKQSSSLNSDASHGGAIFTRGTLTCTDCTFTNCKSDQGGAICVFNKGNATITGGSITKCVAYHRGGAAAVGNTDQFLGYTGSVPSGTARLTIDGVTIGGSTANGNQANHAFGGGVYSEFSGATAIIKGGTNISYNKSKQGGHGVCVADMGDIDLSDCNIHHNSSVDNSDFGGGGVYIGGTVTDGATAEIKAGCKVYNNSASRGAGVYIAARMYLTMSGGSIYDNTTYTGGSYSNGGGGVFMAGSSTTNTGRFTMTGGSIYRNTATSNPGGGVYLGGGSVIMSGGNIYDNTSGLDGGAIYQNYGSFTMSGGAIYGNKANPVNEVCANNGGGIYLKEGDATISGSASIRNNQAKNGAGLYLENGTFTMNGGQLYGNEAVDNGGGAYLTANCIFAMNGGSLGVVGQNKNKAKNGGGIYDRGKFTMSGTNATIANNEATTNHGGGAYINTTQPTSLTNGSVVGNIAAQNGGGIYVGGGSVVTVSGVSIYDNNATGNGGGIYLTSNTSNSFVMTGGSIGMEDHPNTATNGGGIYDLSTFSLTGGSISYNVATNNGGGAYISTEVQTTLSNGTVGNNEAGNDGGGIYLANGSVNLTGITFDNNQTVSNGGGLYASGSVTMQTGSSFIKNIANNGGAAFINGGSNTANFNLMGGVVGGSDANANIANHFGGGFYVTGSNSSVEVQGGEVSYNKALGEDGAGGGLYMNGGEMVFSNGTFAGNSATSQGGGIYIKSGATLNLRGLATITSNHVPASGKGGGVYLDGDLTVGNLPNDPIGTHKLKVEDNFSGTPNNLNNVYLPRYESVITLLSDISEGSKDEFNSHIGFSVNEGFCPVIFADEQINWLAALMGSTSTLNGAIFDDSQRYIAIHVMQDSGPFDKDYIYLWGCWTSAVTSNPGVDNIELIDGVYHIKSNDGLSWFSSLVNGLNHREGDANSNPFTESQPELNAVLDADVDMSEFLWVPIGSVTSFNTVNPQEMSSIFTAGGEYRGTFDGQGHVISGLDCRYITAVDCYGLFGTLSSNDSNSAVIKNTFVDNYNYLTQDSGLVYNMGGIAGEMEGTSVISNCEARGLIRDELSNSNSSMGGLVGKMLGTAEVHSSMAMPQISDGSNSLYIGGLVGFMEEGNSLKNSYTYSMFGTTTNNVGGLVGVNNGTVENCYVRLQPNSQTSKFGWFAGTNNGIIRYCYAPMDETTYVKGGNGTLEGHGNYGATALVNGKYGYNHQDQQIELAPEQSNDYVVNGVMGDDGDLTGLLATLNNWVEEADGVYSMWTRTMASTINDDLPILEFDDFVATASNDDVYLIYKDNLNDMIDDVNEEGGVIYMYKSSEEVVSSNTNDNVRVYIAPNTGILQADDNTLNARVGVVFDNDADNNLGGAGYDWHMFSTPLADAPLGITYNDPETHYYGYVIPATNITLGSEGYFPANTPFNSFDFYCYSEEYYHWVNFKRHSNDHWHQDEPHDQIPYNNEDNLLIGKGYMMAVDQPTMLMSEGVLNNGDADSDVTYTSDLSSYQAPLRGVNLVGNPYQSYLDASAFLTANNLNTYYILDANANGYIAYTKGGSTDHVVNPSPNVVSYNVIAPAFIHPHQGFFVRVPEGMTKVDFTNDMRAITGGTFRNANVNYPMVNMICSDANGYNDFATIELDRPDMGGGEKIKDLRTGDASIWFSMDDKDWQIAFAPMGTTSAPLRFEAHSDGVYTMRWTTANGDFSYLHLVDHVTGADVDCLATSEYRFEATTHDYQSRFNVVFEFTGVDENSTSDYDAFAFMMDDELVVNGEGVLQVFDVNGRMLKSIEVNGTQTTISLPDAANGVYVLRLTNNSEVRIQKMVINK